MEQIVTQAHTRKMISLVVVAFVFISVTAGGAAAQQATAPSVTLTDADVTVDVGENRQVTSTYRFNVAEPGSGEKRLTEISGTLWSFPNHEVNDISAEVNGQQIDPTVSRHDRHLEVGVPVESVSSGETVTVTLTYTVSGPAGIVKTPLWVPNYETSGSSRVIDMTVNLPDGSQLQGSEFPTYDTMDGNALQYNLLHVPSMVYLEYGTGSGSVVALDTLLSAVGIVFIITFFAAWLRFIRSQTGGDNVA